MTKDNETDKELLPDTNETPQRDKTHKSTSKASKPLLKEAILEFVEAENGTFVLRESGDEEAVVVIDFSDKIKELVGQDTLKNIGHHMIQAGLASFMQQQMNQWSAHVYETSPDLIH